MKMNPEAIEKYRAILEKDPKSQVFAPLAEAYREMGMLKEAEKIVTAGVQRHPQFVSGLVTHAKVMRDLNKIDACLSSLKKATALAPENILAHQMLAETHILTKNPKEALKAFKMVLFLNPNSKSAQLAVQKLESLTADEYDEDVFSMSKLPEVTLDSPVTTTKVNSGVAPEKTKNSAQKNNNKSLERILSLVDAFIIRNDLEKARALLNDSQTQFGSDPEISRRLKSLLQKTILDEEAVPLRPLPPRNQLIREKKLETLEMMLRRIDEYRSQG